ncbi:MAG: sigma-70 family RNA polymerase sigma factor [Rhodocyclaceae bacterium]|nr:sigma-70 family RNA polymerase sigma factor [Rhodocyclaceae bacterium]
MTLEEKFVQELLPLRRDMLCFARLQLRDDYAAADLVQEAFTTAYEKRDGFCGRSSSLKTWFFAILRNKIIDMLRSRNSGLQFVEADGIDAFFDESGDWIEEYWPAVWGGQSSR